MNRMRRGAGVVIGLGLAGLSSLTTASAVLANSRQTTVIAFDGINPDTGFCDYPVSDTEEGTFIVADEFDRAGILYRTIVTSFGQLTLTLTNPANGQSTTTHNESQVVIVDWQADGPRETVRRMGVSFAFTYPGAGVILLQVGYFERDYVTGWRFVAGPHDLVEGNFDAPCAALA